MMNIREVNLADDFTASALHGVLPLVIWAAHFFLCYASAEVACALHLQRFTLGGVAAPTVWLWVVSLAAIAMLFVLTVVAVRQHRVDADSGNTQAIVRIGAAILALVGVLWSWVPIAIMHGPAACYTMR